MAQKAPQSKSEFCRRVLDKSIPKKMLDDPSNRLHFLNSGGLIGGGVCWWHSVFTRQATLFAYYAPHKKRLAGDKLYRLVRAVAHTRRPIEIPGFSNLRGFSKYARKVIQKRLEKMQMVDGFIKQHWIVGLWGHARSTDPNTLYKRVLEIQNRVEVKNEIVYLKLQIPGIVSHAWLINGVKRKGDKFIISYIDSNYMYDFVKYIKEGIKDYSKTYTYTIGDNKFKRLYGGFVPHIEEVSIYKNYDRNIFNFCF